MLKCQSDKRISICMEQDRFLKHLHEAFGSRAFTAREILRHRSLFREGAAAAGLPKLRWAMQVEALMNSLAARTFIVEGQALTIVSLGNRHTGRWRQEDRSGTS